MNLKIDDSNYEYYKNIFEIISNNIFSGLGADVPEFARPINVLNETEKQSKSLAKKSLKEGLRDSISSLKHYPLSIVDLIDTDLKRNSLPGIRVLQSIVNDTINKVLERKGIKNLDEYYIVKEVLIDQSSEIDEKNKALLDQYFYDFEFKTKKGK